ncbi:MAG: cell wall hydrolase, partial [Paracoccaceae bacterium]|nr:cell wall hydrolase [Paracoccaceae bacterium]
NRVDAKQFPNSVCKVVSEGATKLHSCQFSYNCDGKPEFVNDSKSYKRILKLANMFYSGTARLLTGGATFYHTKDVNPSWTSKLKKTRQIGGHIFYKIESRVAQK